MKKETPKFTPHLFFVLPTAVLLDNIIFDSLGLTQGERDVDYEAVVQLVRNRLEKAKSIKLFKIPFGLQVNPSNTTKLFII